ncbi:MAG: hypothetical protein Q8L95_02590 [Burkholderiales bacterium]|nr:hypothetical protein [Burkholderiales bacterium]
MPDSSIIAVLAALAGVTLAQGVAMLQSWLDRKNKREILLRTKYEELGMLVLDSMKLPEDLLRCSSHEETLTVVRQRDANKAHLLALVYFPLLRESTGQYIESYAALALAAISLYDPEDKRMLGTQVYDKPTYNAARNAHLAARNRLQDEIEIHSATYAKS